ncbi:MAG: thioredoxin domain-containing protein, partial [Bellilinea sp.]
VRQIAIVWDENANDKEIDDLLKVPLRSYYPRTILAFSSLPLPDNSPALLKDRSVMNGKPTAYVCRDFTCQLPVNNPQDLKNQLG